MVSTMKLFYQAPACESVTLCTEGCVLGASTQTTTNVLLLLTLGDTSLENGGDLGNLE